MQNIVSILKIVLPLVVSLGIGFFARKRDILSPEAIEGMKTFVMKFALPAMLLASSSPRNMRLAFCCSLLRCLPSDLSG